MASEAGALAKFGLKLRSMNSCCCGCCTLRTGSLALGIIGVVLSALATIMSIGQVGRFFLAASQIQNRQAHLVFFAALGNSAALYLATAVTSLIIDSLLVIGVQRERSVLMLPWLVTLAVFMMNFLIWGVVYSIMLAGVGFPIMLLILIAVGLIFAISFYFFCVVAAHYLQVKASSGVTAARSGVMEAMVGKEEHA